MEHDILVSADGHIIEPPDLYRTRLPKHLRHRAAWEEELEREPLGDDNRRFFRRTHAPGFEGWSYSRNLHHDGSPNTGDPDRIIEDMDHDGLRAQVMHPNLTLFWVFTDDHEFSMAHARVYNDYAAETFSGYRDRIAPTAVIPLTDLGDAVAEIERVAGLGFRAVLLPACPPLPYFSRDLDPVWEAASASGLTVMFHLGSGEISVHGDARPSLELVLRMNAAARCMSDADMVDRIVGQATLQTLAPQQIIASLVGGGVTERFPDLHFALIEFNAHWLASLMGGMDKAFSIGIGQDPDYWVGEFQFEDGHLTVDQPLMGQLFNVNGLWPYPLAPSEYVKRQIHVSFQDDPVAVACRSITGVSPLVWGADYPHPEGTFGHSHELVASLFAGVDPSERAAIVGGTMAELLGFAV